MGPLAARRRSALRRVFPTTVSFASTRMCRGSAVTGHPLAREHEEGVWGNREVPPRWTVRRGLAGETWFPPRERAGGEGQSRRVHLHEVLERTPHLDADHPAPVLR